MTQSSRTYTTSTSLYNVYIYREHDSSYSITLGVEWSILFHKQLYIDMIESSGTHTTSTSLYIAYIYWEHELLHHIGWGVEYLVPQSKPTLQGLQYFDSFLVLWESSLHYFHSACLLFLAVYRLVIGLTAIPKYQTAQAYRELTHFKSRNKQYTCMQ